MKYIALSVLALIFVLPFVASAHSTVSPSEAFPSRYQTFTLGVPTEKDMPTIGMRLLVPEGLERVTPFVKPGWNIQIIKDAAAGEKVTEIRWTGGSIPQGQKDAFEFTARTPATPMKLAWKAYQTYADGSVVAWDQEPAGEHETGAQVKNPYSVTTIVLDTPVEPKKDIVPLVVSVISLVLSLIALVVVMRKKHV